MAIVINGIDMKKKKHSYYYGYGNKYGYGKRYGYGLDMEKSRKKKGNN